MRISQQPSYILHYRLYRETSLLLDVFTEKYGRISLLARGARKGRLNLRSILQPFQPLLLSWQGKGELMTLTAAETNGVSRPLHGTCLFSGFYLNELLFRMLPKEDPHPRLYTIYQQTLLELQSRTLQQKTLRLFEKKLLEELGYGISLQHDFSTGKQIVAEANYQFHPEQGFKQIDELRDESRICFKGKSLLAFADEQLHDEESLRDAKQLMRLAFAELLGGKPLQTRKLFHVAKKDEEKY